jgi:hypothetical protein
MTPKFGFCRLLSFQIGLPQEGRRRGLRLSDGLSMEMIKVKMKDESEKWLSSMGLLCCCEAEAAF